MVKKIYVSYKTLKKRLFKKIVVSLDTAKIEVGQRISSEGKHPILPDSLHKSR